MYKHTRATHVPTHKFVQCYFYSSVHLRLLLSLCVFVLVYSGPTKQNRYGFTLVSMNSYWSSYCHMYPVLGKKAILLETPSLEPVMLAASIGSRMMSGFGLGLVWGHIKPKLE